MNKMDKMKQRTKITGALALAIMLVVAMVLTACSQPGSSDTPNQQAASDNASSGSASSAANSGAAAADSASSGSAAASAAAADTSGTASTAAAQTINPGESLVIPVTKITSKASFYPLEVDGTSMEVLAVKAPDGSIRTAFNTCEVCFDSGRGYYVQEGDYLVCQNCGNRFATGDVEVEANGCNPWPIFVQDKEQTMESISVSYDVLAASEKVFANWKRSS